MAESIRERLKRMKSGQAPKSTSTIQSRPSGTVRERLDRMKSTAPRSNTPAQASGTVDRTLYQTALEGLRSGSLPISGRVAERAPSLQPRTERQASLLERSRERTGSDFLITNPMTPLEDRIDRWENEYERASRRVDALRSGPVTARRDQSAMREAVDARDQALDILESLYSMQKGRDRINAASDLESVSGLEDFQETARAGREAELDFSLSDLLPGSDRGRVREAAQYLTDPQARASRQMSASIGGATDFEGINLDLMTPEEQDIFFYYVGKEDHERAADYLDHLERTLNARRQQQFSETARRVSEENPAVGTVANLMSNYAAPAAFFANLGQTAKNIITGENVPTDYNSPWFTAAHLSSDTREGVSEAASDLPVVGDIEIFGENLGSQLANAGLSIGQNLSYLPFGPAGALAYMGASAAGQTTTEALERGASSGQALALGALSGAVEVATEKIGIDRLFSIARREGASGIRRALLDVGIQAATEGAEEAVSEVANTILDAVVMADNSNFALTVTAYEAQGYSEERAKRQAFMDALQQVGAAAFGGALSGGIMGGGASILSGRGSRGHTTAQSTETPAQATPAETDAVSAELEALAREKVESELPPVREPQPIPRRQRTQSGQNNTAEIDSVYIINKKGSPTTTDAAQEASPGPTSKTSSRPTLSSASIIAQTPEESNSQQAGSSSETSPALRALDDALSSRKRIPISEATALLSRTSPQEASDALYSAMERGEYAIDAEDNLFRVHPQEHIDNRTTVLGERVAPNEAYISAKESLPGALSRQSGGEAASSARSSLDIVKNPNGPDYVGTKSYRKVFSGEHPISSYAGYAMFSDDPSLLEGAYGEDLYIVDHTSLPDISDFNEAIASAWDKDVEEGMLPTALDTYTDMFRGGEDVAAAFNPTDIVDSADAWDNPDLISWAFEKGIFDDIPGVKTSDGAIVWDEDIIQRGDVDAEIWGMDAPHSVPEEARTGAKLSAKPSEEAAGDNGQVSVGAAPSGFDQWSQFQLQRSEFYPEGANAARPVDVPTTDPMGRPISKSASTVMGARAIPDELIPEIQNMVLSGELSYDRASDKTALDNARKDLVNDGWQGSLAKLKDAVSEGILSKNNVAMAQVMLNNAANARDERAMAEILLLYRQMSTRAGQTLQAMNIFRKLSPESQLYGATQTIGDLEQVLRRKYKDKAPDLTIDPDLIEKFRRQTTQEGRDAVMEEIYQNAADQVPANWMDKWNAWRYMAMLLNPRTHVRNVVGNLFFQPVRVIKNEVAAAIETGVERTTGKSVGRTKSFAAAPGLYRAAWKDFEQVRGELSGNRYQDVRSEVESRRTIFKKRKATKALERLTGKKFSKGVLETLRTANSWALEAEDILFKRITYADSLAGYLHARGVTAEQMENGTVDEKLLRAARDHAGKEALKATYQDRNALSDYVASIGRRADTNSVGKAINALAEGVLPFRRTPANILVRGAEYGPLGLIKSLTYDLVQVKKGNMSGAEAIDHIAAGLTGSGLIGLGALLFLSGAVTSGGGDDDNEDTMNALTGVQNYALRLPDGTNVTLDWLAPEVIPFLMGVEFADSIGQNGWSVESMLDALAAIGNVMLETTTLQSLNDLIDSVSYAESSGKLGGLVVSALTSYFTQAIPTIGGQAERSGQDVRMTTYTDRNNRMLSTDMQYTIGRASSRVPGWDYQQIPYIDAWGRMEDEGGLFDRIFNNFLNPAYSSTENITPADELVMDLYEETGEASVVPKRPERRVKIAGEDVYLDGDQYVEYATQRGQTSFDILTELARDRIFRNMNANEQVSAVERAYTYANQSTLSDMFGKYEPSSWVAKLEDAPVSVEDYILFDVAYSMLEADKDRDGESIPGSKQEKVIDYLEDMSGLTDDERAFLFDMKYPDSKNNPFD